ncbi:polysaccharide deacetylase family protein [Salmonella enterica]|nr:carbohydrate transporter [Salmonella enterica subsp. enterica serovar Orientalis]EBJ4008358.1 carbohydrate transporter [Salmonella enterica]EBQ9235390.1 carbohydrate transporter [Salmonella enterica subsp. enterica serovar Orientalis]EKA1666407.1 polysaccharide deacetylase family protein [Salmonella enterica]
MYHHVGHKPGLVTLSPGTFRAQMAWLAASGWKTLSSAEVELFYLGGRFPRKSVMLTFDDGWLDNWLQVFPVLKEFNLRVHIFLITGLVGDGPVRQSTDREYSHRECEQEIAQGRADNVMLRWSEVAAMRESGLVEFHVHTHTHTRWDRVCDTHSEQYARVMEDILTSRTCLKAKTGFCSTHLCWPEGYYSMEYVRLARDLGFCYLYTTERRMNTPGNGPFRIGRISTKEREDTAWLKRRLFCYTTPFFSSLLALHKGRRLT